MNGTILKYLLLTLVVLFNGYAYYINVPAELLLKMHLSLAIAILVGIFLLKNNIVNLLLLWFFFALFEKSAGVITFPMLPAISPHRLILGLMAVIFIVEMLMQKRRVLSFSAVEIAMMFFSVYLIFSMLISGTIYDKEHGLTLGLYLAPYGMPYVIFFISKNIIDDETKTKKFFFFLTVIGLYLGLTAIFEYLDFRPLIFPRNIISWQHGARALGPFLHAPVNGTVMGMLLFVPIFLLLHENKRWKKYLYVITTICLLFGILFSFTRSAWLGSLAAIFTMPVLIPRVRKTFFISLLIFGFLSLLFVNFYEIKTREFGSERELIAKKATLTEIIIHRVSSMSGITGRADSRINLLMKAFMMFEDEPIFGHGYGAWGGKYGISIQSSTAEVDMSKKGGIHSTLIALMVDVGLVGISIYVFIYFYIFNVFRKLYKKLPRGVFLGRDLMAICLGSFIVFLINTELFDMRFFLFPNSLFFCVAGIMAGFYQRSLQSKNLNPTT